MNNKISIFSITLALILTIPTFLNAMSYSVNKNYMGYNLIYASGHIRNGDLHRLRRYVRNSPRNRQTIVVFNSNGGELSEGLKIGRFLRDKHVGTAVRKNGICASSCALAFLGGRSLNGSKLMIVPDSAKLGFHSFYYRNGNYVRLNKVQKDVSNILNYASYVGAPSYLMAKMFDTKSSSMYFVNSRDKINLSITSGLKNVSFLGGRVASSNVSNGYSNSYVPTSTSAVNYVRKYLTSYNRLVASSSGSNFYSGDVALNNNGYHGWLTKNLRYIHLSSIKSISSNRVEAKVIYSLKTGKRVCSKNIYTLAKTYSGDWKILKKQHNSCNIRNRELLKKIAYALP